MGSTVLHSELLEAKIVQLFILTMESFNCMRKQIHCFGPAPNVLALCEIAVPCPFPLASYRVPWLHKTPSLLHFGMLF